MNTSKMRLKIIILRLPHQTLAWLFPPQRNVNSQLFHHAEAQQCRGFGKLLCSTKKQKQIDTNYQQRDVPQSILASPLDMHGIKQRAKAAPWEKLRSLCFY